MKEKLKNWFYAERQAFELIHGVCLAIGIAVYFGLPFEPDIFVVGILIAVCFVLMWIVRNDIFCRFFCRYMGFFCLGIFVCCLRTLMVAAPVLDKPHFSVVVSGVIELVEARPDGSRITLKNVTIEDVNANETPYKIRLNYPKEDFEFRTGDTLKGTAHILPPMLPAEPGAYDFSRAAFYMRLGAVGKLLDVTDYVKTDSELSWHSWIERLRQTIEHKTLNVMSKETAAVAIPLMIGDQGYVTAEIYDLYRKAGIIHVLSVSGFHLTLLAGIVFFVIRMICACIPVLRNGLFSKKLSALIAIAVVSFYLLISGLQIPAVRSWMMILFVLGGVMINRLSLSLRTAVLVCGMILLFIPEELLSVSFQLSFMAVFALLSLYQKLFRIFCDSPYRHKLWYKAYSCFMGVVCVSLLAGLATAPFAAYHFNQFCVYSILGNLMTGFLFSFVIMPCLLCAVLLMPIGGEIPFLHITGFCLDKITEMCRWISTLPFADVTVPAFDLWGLFVFAFGLLILFFFETRFRYVGIFIFCLAFGAFYTIPKPDVYVASNGLVAVRDDKGLLHISDKTLNPLVSDVWLKRNGQNPMADTEVLFKDKSVVIKGKRLAFSSLACLNADMTFISKYEFGDCSGQVYTPADIFKAFGFTIFVSDKIQVKPLISTLKNRPWTLFRLQKMKKSL